MPGFHIDQDRLQSGKTSQDIYDMLQGDIPVKQYSCTTEVAAQLFAKAQWEL